MKAKMAIGWALSWALYWIGHWISRTALSVPDSWRFPEWWYENFYALYRLLMLESARIQDWGGIGPWTDATEW
jgi:hypothetical protein